MSYQDISICVDGSKQADMVFEKAVDTAKTSDAKLCLLSIINGERYPGIGPDGYGFVSHSIYDSVIETMQKKLADYKKRAEAVGVKDVKTDVKAGNVKVELAGRYPKENDTDLIIIGAAGLNVIGRLLAGSTVAYTTHETPCDVTIVKTNLEN